MKHLFIVMCVLYYTSTRAQVDKVEHFYIKSPHAEKLFHFFKTNFQLPVIWEYQTWSGFSSGSFESGGLTLGNVAMEFVRSDDGTPTIFEGIGLQPQGSAENAAERLDAVKLIHDPVNPFVSTLNNGAKDTPWAVFAIKNMLPKKADIFYCDYKHRNEINKGRRDASDSLTLLHGGPLGIIGMKAIVVGCEDLTATRNQLLKLPGIKRKENDLFTFDTGPAIQLMNSTNAGIAKIVIQVSSIAHAKQFLQSKNLLGNATANSLYISPKAIDGLNIELVEK